MKRLRLNNTLVLFVIGALCTALLYYALSFLDNTSYLRIFFFRSWPIHVPNTCLFVMGLLFLLAKQRQFRNEEEVIKRLNIREIPTVSPDAAKELLDAIPPAYRETSCFLRLSELLRGYLHQEDVITLNGELSRRDRELIDSGHLFLESLRQIIPILGFLGTVLGLSLGMLRFPEFVTASSSVQSLKEILKDFAAALSVAFETTLLALVYTIIIVLLESLLRRKEELNANGVDEKARELLGKIQFKSELDAASRAEGRIKDWLNMAEDKFTSAINKLVEALAAQNGYFNKDPIEISRQQNDEIIKKLEDIKKSLQESPREEPVVNP